MLNKSFDSIDKEDIDNLILNSVSESKTLEYKEVLPGNTDNDKREFLADVSSFANASGGILIYGIREKRDETGKNTGLPDSIVGLGDINTDGEILRLENILRSGITPRIIGLQIKTINGFSSGEVLIIKVPLSWNAPHMVAFNKSSRFFSRNNAGKYPLDVDELRNAFIASVSLKEQIRQFRADRIAKLVAEEGPTKLPSGPQFMLHLIPIATFGLSQSIDIRSVYKTITLKPPGDVRGWSRRLNLDGLLSFSEMKFQENRSYSYVQLFRNGLIEAACTLTNTYQRDYISGGYEQVVLNNLSSYIKLLQGLAINPPIIIFLTLIGVKGYTIGSNQFNSSHFERDMIDRDILIVPEVSLEDYSIPLMDAMRTSFDVVWQASGYEGSPNYDESGRWRH